jgi:Aspartyl protease/PDZ domain
MGDCRRAAAWATAASILIASAAQAAPAPAAEPTLAQIVDRYIAWRGGDAFRAEPQDFHALSDVKLFGVAGTIEDWHTPDHWRTDVHAPGMSIVAVITANGAWTTSLNGQVLATPDAYKYAKRDPQTAKALEGKDGDTVSLLDDERIDGRTWRVVRVSYGDADTYDAFIDPATGELGATRTTEKGQQTFDHLSDWRWVKGVRWPFATHETSPAGDEKIATVTRIEVGEPIAAAVFARPQPAGRLTYAGGASSTGWIPFTGLEDNRIFLPVTVNGQPATAILDSGAGTELIDSGFAASVALKPMGALPLGGENAVGSGALITGVDIGVGGATLKNTTVTTTNLRALGATQPMLIGDDIFFGAVVDIDFAGRRLALRDPASFQPPSGAIVVQLVGDGVDQLVPISIEGGPTALFMLDTGLPFAMRISPRLAEGQHLLAGRPSIDVLAGGIGGTAPGKVASLKSLDLGGADFSNVPVMFSNAWPSASYTDRIQGLLGVALLSRFRVIVDWPHGRLYLIPQPGATTAPFPRDRLGLIWTRDGQAMRISVVRPGSPADRAGLRAGELIDTVNGRPAADAADIGDRPAGTQVTLVGRPAAATTTVTLTDYY